MEKSSFSRMTPVGPMRPLAGRLRRVNGSEKMEPSKITPTHWYPYSFFLFSSSRAPPQPSAAGDVVSPRSVVAAAPVTLEAFGAQTAPVEANPTPHARRRFAASSITATLDRYAGRYGVFGFSM